MKKLIKRTTLFGVGFVTGVIYYASNQEKFENKKFTNSKGRNGL